MKAIRLIVGQRDLISKEAAITLIVEGLAIEGVIRDFRVGTGDFLFEQATLDIIFFLHPKEFGFDPHPEGDRGEVHLGIFIGFDGGCQFISVFSSQVETDKINEFFQDK